MRETHLTIAVLAVFCAAGCGGGGGSAPALSAASGDGSSRNALTVEVLVPAVKAASAASRKPDYFSPSTQSVVITAVGPSPSTTATIAYVNVDTSNPACTGYEATTCNVSIPLTKSGTYAFTFVAYDHTQTSNKPPFVGRPLATNQTQVNYVAGQTKSYTVDLDGIPAYFAVSPNGNGYLQGSRNGLILYGPSTQEVIVESLDRVGNPIIGPGAPAVSLTSFTSSLVTKAIGTSSPNIFTIGATTTGSPAVVTPASLAIVAKAVAPAGSGAGQAALTIPVTVRHSVIAVSTASKTFEFLDGNATPSITLSQPGPVAVDPAGNVFAGGTINVNIREYPAGSSSPTLSIPANGEQQTEIAVDPADKLYVSDCENSEHSLCMAETYVFASGSSTQTSVFNGNDSVATVSFAVDASGGQYDSLEVSNPSTYADSGLITTPSATIATSGPPYPGAIAVDGSQTAYVVFGKTVEEFPHGANQPNRTLSGLSTPTALAVDAAGTVFAADAGKGGVAVFANQNLTASSLISVSGASSVAVTPSSAFAQ